LALCWQPNRAKMALTGATMMQITGYREASAAKDREATGRPVAVVPMETYRIHALLAEAAGAMVAILAEAGAERQEGI
jgi:hypothetical protein